MDSWKGDDPWGAYSAEIDRRLDEARPERSASGDKEWREDVYGWARNHIPNESNLVRYFAEKIVDSREARATRRGNKLMRAWAKGHRPLLWTDLGPLPVVVDKVRIRLDAVTPDDMDDAARELLAAGKATYDEVVLLGMAMQDLARNARRHGFDRVALLGDLEPRHNDDGIVGRFDDDLEDDDLDDDEDE